MPKEASCSAPFTILLKCPTTQSLSVKNLQQSINQSISWSIKAISPYSNSSRSLTMQKYKERLPPSPNSPKKIFLEIRACACSPFLCHLLFAVPFFLFFFFFTFLPLQEYVPLQVRVVNLPSLPWTWSWNVLCCQNYQKSPLEMTFGNPSCSAGRKGRGGEARRFQLLLSGCPPTR